MRQVGQQPAGISSIGIVALVEEGTNFRNQSGERAFLDDLPGVGFDGVEVLSVDQLDLSTLELTR